MGRTNRTRQKTGLYVDASVLVSLAISQNREISQTLKSKDLLYTSELSIVESQSGISHQLDKKLEARALAEQNLNRLWMTFQIMSVDGLVLGRARSLIRQYRSTIGLRTLDAIHLATASLIRVASEEMGSTLEFVTADKRQNAAFTAEGFVGELYPT